MRKTILLLCSLLLLYSSVAAAGAKIGVGVFGGLDQPVGLEDQKQGSVFGIRGKLKAFPVITFEPFLSFSKFGDPDYEDFPLGVEGSDVNAYGVDAVLGAPFGAKGFAMFGIVGAGFYNIKNDQIPDADETNLGWSAGLGFGIGFTPMVSLDVRGKLNVIPYEGGGSFKSVSATAGVNYHFGM